MRDIILKYDVFSNKIWKLLRLKTQLEKIHFTFLNFNNNESTE